MFRVASPLSVNCTMPRSGEPTGPTAPREKRFAPDMQPHSRASRRNRIPIAGVNPRGALRVNLGESSHFIRMERRGGPSKGQDTAQGIAELTLGMSRLGSDGPWSTRCAVTMICGIKEPLGEAT